MIEKTTTALLNGLVDPANEAIWREFDTRYRPILIAFARRVGLTDADAADAAQETLVRFVKAYRSGSYDRDRGRLRSWLIGIARNCIREMWNDRARRHEDRGMSAIVELPGEDELTQLWDEECREQILRRGFELLRETTRMDEQTINAFEQLAIDRRTPADVAETLSMTLNDVYLAKHRCLKRLRSIIEELEQRYELA